MSAINVWNNVQNDFNIKYLADKKNHGKQFTTACHLQISFRTQIMHSKNPSLTIFQNII